MTDIYEVNNVNGNYVPLEHSMQSSKALPNHVIILYFDEDALIFAEKESSGGSSNGYMFLGGALIIVGIIMLVLGSRAEIGLSIGGIIVVVIGIGFVAASVRECIKRPKLDSSNAYSYYCYDLTDQCVKLCIIDKQTKSLINNNNNNQSITNWGYIANINQVSYDENASKESLIALEDVNDTDINNMLTFKFERSEFATIMTARIVAIQTMGLNDLELKYLTMQGSNQSTTIVQIE